MRGENPPLIDVTALEAKRRAIKEELEARRATNLRGKARTLRTAIRAVRSKTKKPKAIAQALERIGIPVPMPKLYYALRVLERRTPNVSPDLIKRTGDHIDKNPSWKEYGVPLNRLGAALRLYRPQDLSLVSAAVRSLGYTSIKLSHPTQDPALLWAAREYLNKKGLLNTRTVSLEDFMPWLERRLPNCDRQKTHTVLRQLGLRGKGTIGGHWGRRKKAELDGALNKIIRTDPSLAGAPLKQLQARLARIRVIRTTASIGQACQRLNIQLSSKGGRPRVKR